MDNEKCYYMIMKKLLRLFILLLILTGCNGKKVSYVSISTDEAIEMMESETNYLILDVRTMAEYESGHIKGAINYPSEKIKDEMLDILPDKDQLIFESGVKYFK